MNGNETINDRLIMIINHYSNGSRNEFATKIGIAPTGMSNYINRNRSRNSKPGAEILERIVRNIPVDARWLLTGEGKMASDMPETEDVSYEYKLQQLQQRISDLEALLATKDETIAEQGRRLADRDSRANDKEEIIQLLKEKIARIEAAG